MKKLFLVLTLVFAGLFLVACGETTENGNGNDNGDSVELPETITMTELDEYLFDPAWQFVDLRNFDDQMADGWIRGFEMIPFFQYLEYTDILVRTAAWSFDGSQIKDEAALRELFDEDRNIVLICAAGVRAAFVREALLHLGYENVWNAGALANYVGDHRVFGDGSFNITLPPKAHTAPLPDEINMENIDQFLGRPGTKFFDFRDVYPGQSAPMLEIGWIDGFTVIPYFAFLAQTFDGIIDEAILTHPGTWAVADVDFDEMLNEDMIFVLENIFGSDKDAELILMCMSGARSGMMKAVLEHLGYTNVWNAGGWRDYEGSNAIRPLCTSGQEGGGDNDECS